MQFLFEGIIEVKFVIRHQEQKDKVNGKSSSRILSLISQNKISWLSFPPKSQNQHKRVLCNIITLI